MGKYAIIGVNTIARICHEANRAYCRSIGDRSQMPWESCPDWQRQSAIDGVLFHLKAPTVGAAASHENWMLHKIGEGWTYGPIKDPERKQHPCLVRFDQLAPEQQAKDYLFTGIVAALAPFVERA
jgi:hypothetical protein